ncbi:MAG: hypothetical protein ABI026_03175, partial [Gemmatimonadaceae bacterium]
MKDAPDIAAEMGISQDTMDALSPRRGGFGGGASGSTGVARGARGAGGAGGAGGGRGGFGGGGGARGGRGGASGAGGMGGGITVPDSVCTIVMKKFKSSNAQAELDSLRSQMRAGTVDTAAMRTKMATIYKNAGVAADTARACMREASGGGGTGAAIGQPVVAFVKTATGWSPRLVRLGVSDFDYTEVVSGLKEGDQVALLATIALQASRDRSSARAKAMVGGALPGGSNTTQQRGGGRPGGGGR